MAGVLAVVAIASAGLIARAEMSSHTGGAPALAADARPVIAELNVRLTPEAQLTAPQRAAQRRRLQAFGEKALASAGLGEHVPAGTARVLTTLPYLTTSVDQAGLRRLRRAPGVKRVTLAHTFTLPASARTPAPSGLVGTERTTAVARAAQSEVRTGNFDNGTRANVAWAWNIYGQDMRFAVIGAGMPAWKTLREEFFDERCFASTYRVSQATTAVSTCHPDGNAISYIEDQNGGEPSGRWDGYDQYAPAGQQGLTWYGYPLSFRGIAPLAKAGAINVGSAVWVESEGQQHFTGLTFSEGDLLAALDQVNTWNSTKPLASVMIGFNLTSKLYDGACPDGSSALRRAIKRLSDNGVSVVVGTPRERTGLREPSCFPEVITVGAVDRSGARQPFTPQNRKVDVLAPSAGILTPRDSPSLAAWNHVAEPGADLSAALVTGAIVLYKQKYPAARPSQVKAALQRTGPTVSMGSFRRHRLAVDQLLNLDQYRRRAGVDRRCLELEFRSNAEHHSGDRFGFVRLRCLPNPSIDRIVVSVNGPSPDSWEEEFHLIPTETDVGTYGDDQIFLGANTGNEKPVTTPGSYRTCYFVYLKTNDIESAASECRSDFLPITAREDLTPPPVPKAVLFPERQN